MNTVGYFFPCPYFCQLHLLFSIQIIDLKKSVMQLFYKIFYLVKIRCRDTGSPARNLFRIFPSENKDDLRILSEYPGIRFFNH